MRLYEHDLVCMCMFCESVQACKNNWSQVVRVLVCVRILPEKSIQACLNIHLQVVCRLVCVLYNINFTKVYEHARTISTSTECMWMCDCELCACAYFVKPYWNIFSMWTCLNNPLQVLDAYDWMRMHAGEYVRGSAHGCACSGHLLSVYRRLHLCEWCGWGICSETGKS